ncbi:MAG: hypothetical protein ACXWFX_11180 [Methylobacter sp.]
MDYFKLATILVSIVISLVGWVIAHRFTSRRDLENKKRETKIDLIIKSYESISLWLPEPSGGEPLKDLVNTLILIQFFGSESQVENAKKALKSIAANSNSVEGLVDLLDSLRKDFRSEIGLSAIEDNVSIIYRSRS